MNTPTHILIAFAVLARAIPAKQGTTSEDKTIEPQNKQERQAAFNRNRIIFLGALLPDLSMFFFFLWAKFYVQADFQTTWRVLYWQEPWQTISAASNSIPFMGALLTAGLLLKRKLLVVLAAAMLLHVGFDLPFHADDAHKHFWPITDFRFHSPLSYWDASHHAGWVTTFEGLILIVGGAILWRRFSNKFAKATSVFPAILHIAATLAFVVFR